MKIPQRVQRTMGSPAPLAGGGGASRRRRLRCWATLNIRRQNSTANTTTIQKIALPTSRPATRKTTAPVATTFVGWV